jgi:Ubiquitin-conjugating enzyme
MGWSVLELMSFKVILNEIQSSRMEKGEVYAELLFISNVPGYIITTQKIPIGLEILVEHNSVLFRLILSSKYPFISPTISCDTITTFPSISDGRDLLLEILTEDWSPIVSLYEIITSIPSFLQKNKLNNRFCDSDSFCETIGKFNLCVPVRLNIWDNRYDMGKYIAVELDLKNPLYSQERVVVITHRFFIVLQPYPHCVGIGHIVFYSSLTLISSLRLRDLETVAFEWKNNKNSFQVFRIRNASHMIQLIQSNLNLFYALKHANSMETDKNTHLQIYKELEMINQLETQILDDSKVFQTLIQKYQTIIEFFSESNDPRYEEFLKKLKKLFSIA